MKQNIGVARGWNIGLNMAETDIVFILNADVHISLEAISKVERGLKTLPQAACVGPQGAYVNFHLCRDYKYFDKGSFSQPLEVDAVSGFFFAVNRRLFAENNLQFENDFTPCYFEEWDIGLQIKRAGLKNYIVPTSAYDHHWSGTIRALHTIPYMGRNEKAGDILLRNRRILLAKWRHIVRRLECPELLESCWKNLLLEDGNSFFFNGDFAAATEISDSLNRHFQNDAKVRAFTRMLNLHNLKSCTNNQKP